MMSEKNDHGESMTTRRPVEKEFDIRIGADGTWFHEGDPINRKALVRLFATILKRESDGSYWLETPVERGRVEVEDAPFVAVAVDAAEIDGQKALIFRTNLDEEVTAGPDHPITVTEEPSTGTPRPYIEVRNGLSARIDRTVYYQLVEMAASQDGADAENAQEGTAVGVWSMGQFFTLGRTA